MYGHLDQRKRQNVTGSGRGCHEPARAMQTGVRGTKAKKKRKEIKLGSRPFLCDWKLSLLSMDTTMHIRLLRVGIIPHHLGIHSASRGV
jgi:hypothetical protein